MFIYNVQVNVDAEVETDWYNWMVEKHIPDVLATGYFVDARVLKVMDQTAAYHIQYRYENPGKLAAYQAGPAAALQKDHTDRFPGKAKASRFTAQETRTFQHQGDPNPDPSNPHLQPGT